MSIIFVKGNLFTYTGLDAIAHGCNCVGAMGKGIAKEFKARYPEMYKAYHRKCKKGEFDIGDVFVWKEDSITIFNLGTQKTWRTKATLQAIEESFQKMFNLALELGIERIGVPRIGAGLGGLEWLDVKNTMQKIAGNYAVELVVFEYYAK